MVAGSRVCTGAYSPALAVSRHGLRASWFHAVWHVAAATLLVHTHSTSVSSPLPVPWMGLPGTGRVHITPRGPPMSWEPLLSRICQVLHLPLPRWPGRLEPHSWWRGWHGGGWPGHTRGPAGEAGGVGAGGRPGALGWGARGHQAVSSIPVQRPCLCGAPGNVRWRGVALGWLTQRQSRRGADRSARLGPMRSGPDAVEGGGLVCVLRAGSQW